MGARTETRMEACEQRTLLAAAPTLWTAEGPGAGGGLFAPVIARNGTDLWINSDMSGIYHSADFGQNWQMQNFHASVGGVNGGTLSQVLFTSDPSTLYIGNTSRGPVKSTSGGSTWTTLGGWSYGTAYWAAADPSTTTKILVSNGTNLYVSSNGGTSFSVAYSSSSLYVAGAFFDGTNVYVGTNKGLLTSTNGGSTFALAAQQPAGQTIMSFTGARQGTTVRLLALSTSSSPAADTNPNNMTYSGLHRLDVGGSWVNKSSAVGTGQKPNFIAMAQTNTAVAYIGGGDPNGRTQVLKTTNGGDAWVDAFFTRPSDVVPNTPNKNTYTAYEGQGGDFDWSWGGPAWGFSVCPTDANKAVISDGFVHVTSDGGATWHQAYENPLDENPAGQYTPQHKAYRGVGLNNTSVHSLTWTSATSLMAGYTDIDGFRSADGGVSWSYPTYNSVVSNTIYQTLVGADGKLYAATSNVHDMYASTHLTDATTNPSWQTGAVVVSADQGASWSMIHSFGCPVVWIERDPSNANRMYASVVDGISSSTGGANGGIWVTSNLNLGASSTWTRLAVPPRTEGHAYQVRVLNDGSLVASYSGRRAGSPEAFTQSSGVFYSTNGGASWVDRTLIGTGAYASPDMSYYTRDIVIDPTDASQNTWYAGVYSGWGGKGNEAGDVYRTSNRGVSWTRMQVWRQSQTPRGAAVSVSSVTINPATKEMYVSTEVSGMLYTADVTKANLTYTDFSDLSSMPFAGGERVFISPYNSQDVWAATFGGGLIRGGVAPDSLTATAAGALRVNLSWADNSANEAGFQIDRATNSGFTQNLVTTTATRSATSLAVTGLASSTTYYFRVRATSGGNSSAYSTAATFTTAALAAPAITGISSDTGRSASDGVTNDQTLTLRGTADPLATVTLSRAGVGAIGTTTAASDGTWTFDYSATVLPAGSWSFTAVASDSGGKTSPISAAYLVTVDLTAPSAGPWASALTHARNVGEVGLVIPDTDLFSEGRDQGVRKIILSFSEAIASFASANLLLAGNDLGGAVDLSAYTINTTLSSDGLTGVIQFKDTLGNDASLPDYARYLIRLSGLSDLAGNALSGDADRVITALKGDASGDLRVNAIDLSRVRVYTADPILASDLNQVRCDITQDGRVNAVDLARVRATTDHDARGIVTPVITSSLATQAGAAPRTGISVTPAAGNYWSTRPIPWDTRDTTREESAPLDKAL